MKAKVYGILILLFLVVPLASTYSYLHIKKQKIKKELKQRVLENLDKENLIQMSFTDLELEKLNWKHSHEFEFNGQMYDVVNKEIHGKTTVLWCWNDSKETAINKQIDKLLAFALGNNQQSKETQKRLNNYFNSLFYNELQPLKIFINHNNYQYSIYKVVYHLLRLSPPSPPPQID